MRNDRQNDEGFPLRRKSGVRGPRTVFIHIAILLIVTLAAMLWRDAYIWWWLPQVFIGGLYMVFAGFLVGILRSSGNSFRIRMLRELQLTALSAKELKDFLLLDLKVMWTASCFALVIIEVVLLESPTLVSAFYIMLKFPIFMCSGHLGIETAVRAKLSGRTLRCIPRLIISYLGALFGSVFLTLLLVSLIGMGTEWILNLTDRRLQDYINLEDLLIASFIIVTAFSVFFLREVLVGIRIAYPGDSVREDTPLEFLREPAQPSLRSRLLARLRRFKTP